MKKLISVMCFVFTIQFLFCSCFNTEIQSISLSESNLEITAGDTRSINVSVEPAEAEAKKITWTTSDNNIATVENGIIKGKSAGNAVVTVQTEDGLKASCNVTVKSKEITDVVLSDTSTSVKTGSRIQLTAKTIPSDAPNDGFVWSSSDESVAVIDSEGFVTGVKEGVATIVCKVKSGKEAACTVTVKSGKPIQPTAPSDSATESTAPDSTAPGSSKNNTDGDIFPESSTRKLSESEVAGLSSERAQAAINEIFARNGYIFKDKELKKYYESKLWYTPDPNFSESKFNEAERYNVALFSKYR